MGYFTALVSYLQEWCEKAPNFYTNAEEGAAVNMCLVSKGLSRK